MRHQSFLQFGVETVYFSFLNVLPTSILKSILNPFPHSDKHPSTFLMCHKAEVEKTSQYTHTQTHKHRLTSYGVMTFLLLWWAASQPVETCKVTLDVESTPAGLRHMEQRLRSSASFVYTNTHSLMHTQSCVVSLLLSSRHTTQTWSEIR